MDQPGVLQLKLDAKRCGGMVANLDTRIRLDGDRVTLTGRLTLPGYWLGRPLQRQPMLLAGEGRMDTLAVLAPMFRGSTRPAARFRAHRPGTVGTPRLESPSDGLWRMRQRRRLTVRSTPPPAFGFNRMGPCGRGPALPSG
jgi:hypothetical protein